MFSVVHSKTKDRGGGERGGKIPLLHLRKSKFMTRCARIRMKKRKRGGKKIADEFRPSGIWRKEKKGKRGKDLSKFRCQIMPEVFGPERRNSRGKKRKTSSTLLISTTSDSGGEGKGGKRVTIRSDIFVPSCFQRERNGKGRRKREGRGGVPRLGEFLPAARGEKGRGEEGGEEKPWLQRFPPPYL